MADELNPDMVEEQLNADPRYQILEGSARVQKRKEVYDKLGMNPPTYIAQPGTRELNKEGAIHKYVRPGLEALGMAGGAVASAPLGPVGIGMGTALGFAGGDALASFAERLAGERPPVTSLAQAGAETLKSIAKGAVLERGGHLSGKLVGKVLAPFAQQYEGANQALDEMAQKRGITLDPHEVLQSRPLALGHKVLENVPFTAGMVQRNEMKKLGDLTREWQSIRDKVGAPDRQRLGEIGTKIQDQVDRHLDELGVRQGEIRDKMRDDVLQAAGSPFTYKELGDQTQRAITDYHAGLKSVEDAAWEYARASKPEGRVLNSKLAEAANQMRKDYEPFPSLLDEPLMKQLKDVAGSGNPAYDKLVSQIPDGLPDAVRTKILQDITKQEQPGWTVDSLVKLRSILSDNAKGHHSGLMRGDAAKGSADQYGRIYTKLIKGIDEDLQSFADAQGSDIANRFKLARAASGQRAALFNPTDNPWVVKAIEGEAATLDRSLILPGNAAGFTALKEKVGESAASPVKRSFTNRLLGVGGKEEGGLAQLRSTLDKYGKQTLAEVYSPQELDQLYALADKSNWMKKSPIGNPFFRELVKTSPAKVAPSILEHPDLTTKTLRAFPNMKQPLRKAFVEGVHPNEKTPFPTRLIDTLNAYPAGVQKQLFTAEELKDFYQMAKIIERTKGTVKLAENPSGTAQNLVTFTTAGAMLKHPIANAPQALGTAAIAKLYLSSRGRKLLMRGLVTPQTAEDAARIASNIGGILGHDVATRPTGEARKQYNSTPEQP